MPSEQEIVKTLIDAGFKVVYVPMVVIDLPECIYQIEDSINNTIHEIMPSRKYRPVGIYR